MRLRRHRAKQPEPQPAPAVYSLDQIVAELRQAALVATDRPCSHGPDCTFGACDSKPKTFATPPAGFVPLGTAKSQRLGDDPTTVQPIFYDDGRNPQRRWP